MNLPVSAFVVKTYTDQKFFDEQPQFHSLSLNCNCEICNKQMNTCSFFQMCEKRRCLHCIQLYYPDTQLVAHSSICSTQCRLEKEKTIGEKKQVNDNIILKKNESYLSEKRCACCNAFGESLLRCIRCKKVLYCDKECQKLHWIVHKNMCK